MELELTTLVVLGTDCIGIWKSNYYTITTTPAPDCSLPDSVLSGIGLLTY
jgi:hypothetical protein